MMRRVPMEAWVLLYVLAYVPNVVMTRLVTGFADPVLGRALTGLETLPASLLVNMVLTYGFIWASGWHRDAHAFRWGAFRLPVPTRWTLLSGVGTGLVLFTVPLSLTFKGVSIPFIQLIMRGDILIIAPLVDMVFGRRVRWWSWAALVMVAGALFITLADRGGLNLPPLAMLTVALYTLGYFLRLAAMTRVGKNGDPATLRAYFVEEKIVALPLSVAMLAAVSASGFGGQSGELATGFITAWRLPALWWLAGIGITLTIVSVLAAIILLGPDENAYCVALDRAASLVAGVVGSVLLAWFWGMAMPRSAELAGAGILIGVIVLLSLAPRLVGERA